MDVLSLLPSLKLYGSFSTSHTPSSIMSEQPKAVCGLAYDCVQRLSPIVRQIDFALDWTELEAGRALYRWDGGGGMRREGGRVGEHCTGGRLGWIGWRGRKGGEEKREAMNVERGTQTRWVCEWRWRY